MKFRVAINHPYGIPILTNSGNIRQAFAALQLCEEVFSRRGLTRSQNDYNVWQALNGFWYQVRIEHVE